MHFSTYYYSKRFYQSLSDMFNHLSFINFLNIKKYLTRVKVSYFNNLKNYICDSY